MAQIATPPRAHSAPGTTTAVTVARDGQWRCRFVRSDGGATHSSEVLTRVDPLHPHAPAAIESEHPLELDGTPACSLGQGE